VAIWTRAWQPVFAITGRMNIIEYHERAAKNSDFILKFYAYLRKVSKENTTKWSKVDFFWLTVWSSAYRGASFLRDVIWFDLDKESSRRATLNSHVGSTWPTTAASPTLICDSRLQLTTPRFTVRLSYANSGYILYSRN